MIGIYQILHKSSGRRYIGSSINVSKRLSHHKNRLVRGLHANDYLQKTFDKYGIEDFEFQFIVQCDQKDLESYEQLVINGYKTNLRDFGFNLRLVAKSSAGSSTKKYSHKEGDTYNRLTLVQKTVKKNGVWRWLCKCSCGQEIEIDPGQVKHNHTKSCGCLNKEKLIQRISKWNRENEPWNKRKIKGV